MILTFSIIGGILLYIVIGMYIARYEWNRASESCRTDSDIICTVLFWPLVIFVVLHDLILKFVKGKR